MTSMELLEIEQVVVGSDVHQKMSTSPETTPVTLFNVKSEPVMAEYKVKSEPPMPGYDVMLEPVTPEYNVATDPLTPKYKVTTDPEMPVCDVKSEPMTPAQQTYPHDPLQCLQCFITFSDLKAWERHMKMNHKLEYKLHQQLVTPEYNLMMDPVSPEHNVVSEPVKLKPVCNDKSTAVTPAQQTYPHDSLQCFQCFITFSDPKAKERHMKKSHKEEYKLFLQKTDTVFTCYACDRKYSTSEKLSEHSASHRTEDKPFRCSYCQATFQTFSEVMSHRRLECRVRQYVCQDCNMVFRSITGRRRHRTTMHLQKVEEGKAYRCCKCNIRFLTEKALVQHQENFANDETCCVPRRKPGRPPQKCLAGDETYHFSPPHRKRGRPPKIVLAGDKPCHINPPPRKRGRPPKNTDEKVTGTDQKIKEPKEGAEEEEELEIPCPEDNCDDVFPSVAALRDHRKERHGPSPHPRKAHLCMDQSTHGQGSQL